MVVSDRDRRLVHDALVEAHGEGPADTMMELLPPVGWGDVARRSDVELLRGEIAGVRTDLHAEIVAVRSDLHGEMAELRGEMLEKFGGLRSEFGGLRSEFGEFKGVMQRQLVAVVVADLLALLSFVFATMR